MAPTSRFIEFISVPFNNFLLFYICFCVVLFICVFFIKDFVCRHDNISVYKYDLNDAVETVRIRSL